MIVKNEDQRLPLILSDIQGLWDELIIVDTGSTDKTIEIAQKFGACVVSQPWTDDFSAARNRSIDEATAAWILWLDADDRMEAAHVKQLQSLIQTLNEGCVYYLPVANTIADGSTQSFLQLRLFPNDPRLRFENRIHESISTPAEKHGFKGANLPIQIIHTGYETPELISFKLQRNLPILEEELAENPDNNQLSFLYANSLAKLNRFEEAQRYYEEIVRKPGVRQKHVDIYYGALVYLARIHDLYNKHKEAAEFAQRAVEVKPQDIQGWYLWGSALMHLNENDAALEKFSRALACPNIISSLPMKYGAHRIFCLKAMTKILLSMGRQPEAKNLLLDAIKQEPSPQITALLDEFENKPAVSEEELLQKAQELLGNQSHAEASKIFLQIIKSNPHSFAAYNGLGLIAWYSGKHHDAYMLFKQAAQTGPPEEDILLNLWDAAQAAGQTKDARDILWQAAQKNPGMEKINALLTE